MASTSWTDPGERDTDPAPASRAGDDPVRVERYRLLASVAAAALIVIGVAIVIGLLVR